MKKQLLFFFFCTSLMLNGQTTSEIEPGLKQKLQSDKRLGLVKNMAENLIKEGFTAGSGYAEVWIRDLNTFIETASIIGDKNKVKESLIVFFKLQGADGNVPDGYTPAKEAQVSYNYTFSDLAPQYAAHKNTVETDQESSLVQAIWKYIYATGDKSILNERVGELTVDERINNAMQFLMDNRYDQQYGLLWGATTVDWGDVQPEHEWGVNIDNDSHFCIDIYDNAMFIVALNNYIEITNSAENKKKWSKVCSQIKKNVRKHLWDKKNKKFIPHIYLNGSPFPDDFNENLIHYHGGTAIAIAAGLLSKPDILTVYNQMQDNVKAAGAQTIGLTIYPVYPNGFFKNIAMHEYGYQNGGDWTWFGGRMVQQLINNGFYEEAYEAISPMLDRVIKEKGFHEWWTPEGEPKGSGEFRGSAGVLWKAITQFEELLL